MGFRYRNDLIFARPASNFICDYLKDGLVYDMNVSNNAIYSFENTTVQRNIIIDSINIVYSGNNADKDLSKFGNIPALTNGILIAVSDEKDNLIKDFTNGTGIKSTQEWGLLADVNVNKDCVLIKWSMTIDIALETNHKFNFIIRDDLSELDMFRAMLHGYHIHGEEI